MDMFSVVETGLYVYGMESLLVAQVVSVIMIMCDMRSALSTMEKYKTDVIVLQTIDNACKLVHWKNRAQAGHGEH